MNIDSLRRYCLSLPHATEGIQWQYHLLFRVEKKIFVGVSLDPAWPGLSFKCTPDEFAELVERDGIIPAPYTARYHWVMLQKLNALGDRELKRRIRDSYDMVFAGLPAKVRRRLGGAKRRGSGISAIRDRYTASG